MLIVDAHEDIAWNALTFGRDYSQSALNIRQSEANTPIPSYNGSTLLGREDWLRGQVAVIFSTLFSSPIDHKLGDWDTATYRDSEDAHRLASAQLDFYHRLVEENPQFCLIGARQDMENVLATWGDDCTDEDRRVGLVPLMEGAEPIRYPEEIETWAQRGVRIIGLAWEKTRYAAGTHAPGPITPEGFRLLDIMAGLGLILDLSHLAEQAYYQAIEAYEGTVIASHANPRQFLPTPRGLSDEMIALLADRGGVIGIVPYNAFLKPGWRKGSPREEVTLANMVDAIDHVCQLTGSAAHVGIGSDFDGGFGLEHVPMGLDSVADLQKLVAPLKERGYSDDQVASIMGGNWLRILQTSLPG